MSNINGYLDFEGLKTYHELAGYSEIPLEYTSGSKLNAATGEVEYAGGAIVYCVTDYVELPVDSPYYLMTAAGSSTICFYDENNNFLSGKTLSGSKYKLVLSAEGAKAVKFRVSFEYIHQAVSPDGDVGTIYQVSIRALHDNTSKWLYDEIVKNDTTIKNVSTDVASIQGNVTSIQGDVTNIQGNISSIQGDIETNSNDITNIKNMVYKAHCTHSININSTIVEIGASTPVYVTKLNFLFNNVAQSAADGVTSAKVYNINNEEIAGVSNSNINTSITQGDSAKLGAPNSTVTVNPGYEIVYNGNTFRGSYTISAVHPIYYGGGTASTITGGSDVSMTKTVLKTKFGSSSLKTGASGSYKITLNSKNYIFIVSPYTISTDKVYNESTGFQFPMDSLGTLTVTNIGADAPNATYYVYRSSYEQDPGTYNMQIKS